MNSSSSFGGGPESDLIGTAMAGTDCVCRGGGGVHDTKRLWEIRTVHFLTKISMRCMHENSVEIHMGENAKGSTHLTQHQPQRRACVWGEGMSRAESDRNYQRPRRATFLTT